MMLHYVETILRAADAPGLRTGHVGGARACAEPNACPRCRAERALTDAARARQEARGDVTAAGPVTLGSLSREEAQTLVAAVADHEQACEALGYTGAARTCRGLLGRLRTALRRAAAVDSAA
jgi:hypothetical protein